MPKHNTTGHFYQTPTQIQHGLENQESAQDAELENDEVITASTFAELPHGWWALITGREIIAIAETSVELQDYLEELLASKQISVSKLYEYSLCQKYNLKFGVFVEV